MQQAKQIYRSQIPTYTNNSQSYSSVLSEQSSNNPVREPQPTKSAIDTSKNQTLTDNEKQTVHTITPHSKNSHTKNSPQYNKISNPPLPTTQNSYQQNFSLNNTQNTPLTQSNTSTLNTRTQSPLSRQNNVENDKLTDHTNTPPSQNSPLTKNTLTLPSTSARMSNITHTSQKQNKNKKEDTEITKHNKNPTIEKYNMDFNSSPMDFEPLPSLDIVLSQSQHSIVATSEDDSDQ